MPWVARRTFSKVKSRAMMSRQPEVPNLMEAINQNFKFWLLDNPTKDGLVPILFRFFFFPFDFCKNRKASPIFFLMLLHHRLLCGIVDKVYHLQFFCVLPDNYSNDYLSLRQIFHFFSFCCKRLGSGFPVECFFLQRVDV